MSDTTTTASSSATATASSNTAAVAASASAGVARRRGRSKRNEFRFQLIRCCDPNRSVARILELKSQQRSNNTLYTLFQLKDVLDNRVLTALLETFRHFVAVGIKWRTLDLQEDMRNNSNNNRGGYNPSLLHELLQVVNESSLFQNIQLTIAGGGSWRNNHHNLAMLRATATVTATAGAEPNNDANTNTANTANNPNLAMLPPIEAATAVAGAEPNNNANATANTTANTNDEETNNTTTTTASSSSLPPPPPPPSSFFQSIERNTRLLKLCIDFDRPLTNEDIQCLVTLLKVSKKLKRLEIKCRSFQIEDLSEGFAHNSTLMSLSLKVPMNHNIIMISAAGGSSMRSMMMELSQHQGLKLKKLTLSGSSDGELSTPLESLLLAHQGLKNVNLHCQASNISFSFPEPPPPPQDPQAPPAPPAPPIITRNNNSSTRCVNAFDAFFRRLSSIAPPSGANTTTTATAKPSASTKNQAQADGENNLEEEERTLDQYLIEQGPLITIGTELYSTTNEQIATIKSALVNYPRLRLSGNSHHSIPSSEIGYENLVNHCGRYLMYRSDVPLALWPVALERAACLESHKRSRSSIIYELLRGGAFAARETYASI